MRKHLLGIAAAVAIFAAGSSAQADPFTGTVSTFGDTTGSGPWNLTSDPSPLTYSGIEIDATSSTKFNELFNLFAYFTDVAGGAHGGSPRFSIGLDTGGGVVKYMHILLGTSPGFGDSDPAAFTTTYSGFNVIGNNDTGRYDIGQFGGSGYTTYADALLATGSFPIVSVSLLVDAGWAGLQEMHVSEIWLNDLPFRKSSSPTATPEPASIALACGGILGIGAMRRKKKVLAV